MSAPKLLDDDEAQEIAADFHDTYERIAPEYDYDTRAESRVPWRDVDPKLQALMVDTVREVVDRFITYRSRTSYPHGSDLSRPNPKTQET